MTPTSPTPSRYSNRVAGSASWVVDRRERKDRIDAFEDLGGRHDLVAAPLPLRIEGHELDEAHPDTLAAAEARELDDLLVVDAAHDDRIHLHRRESRVERGVDAGDDPLELVALRQREERGAVQRVQRDIHATEPGVREVVRSFPELHAVGRERKVDTEWRELLDQTRDVRTYERFTTGEPDRLEAETLDADARHASDLLVRQQLVLR